jgi:hypothetical protein
VLGGVRILSFTHFLQGPSAVQILADLSPPWGSSPQPGGDSGSGLEEGVGLRNDNSNEVCPNLGKQGTEAKLGYFCRPRPRWIKKIRPAAATPTPTSRAASRWAASLVPRTSPQPSLSWPTRSRAASSTAIPSPWTEAGSVTGAGRASGVASGKDERRPSGAEGSRRSGRRWSPRADPRASGAHRRRPGR